MQDIIINKCMNIINESKDYTDEKKEVIEYGLISIYMFITKSIFIFGLAIILGIFKELLLFLIFYNFIRIPSFGIHANKSYICLISSISIFFITLYISLYININIYIKLLLGIYTIIRIYENAPADTENRPILNKKRRYIYKYISTFISIIYMFVCLTIKDNYISNILLFSLLIQTLVISPYTYKLFGMKYDNYKDYIK